MIETLLLSQNTSHYKQLAREEPHIGEKVRAGSHFSTPFVPCRQPLGDPQAHIHLSLHSAAYSYLHLLGENDNWMGQAAWLRVPLLSWVGFKADTGKCPGLPYTMSASQRQSPEL